MGQLMRSHEGQANISGGQGSVIALVTVECRRLLHWILYTVLFPPPQNGILASISRNSCH
jgi:hypothetical protein